MILCITGTAFSQNTYYYYDGQKVPLEINSNRASIFIPTGTSASDLTYIKSLASEKYLMEDDYGNYNISVIDLKTVTPLSNMTQYETVVKSLQQKGLSSCWVTPIYKDAQDEEIIATDYLYVKLKSSNDYNLLSSKAQQYQLVIDEVDEFMPLWYTLRVTAQSNKSSIEIANLLYESGLFASAVPDFSYDMEECVTDELFRSQWGLKNSDNSGVDISVCQAWEMATGKGVNIAIIDGGIYRTNSELASNMHSLRYNAEKTDGVPFGIHGTQCAAIAAAAINNGGMAGVAPNAKIMETRTLIKKNKRKVSRKLAKCINWAWQNGADVISCSWGTKKTNLLKDAIDNALTKGRNGKGTIIVNSAGNKNSSDVTWPGNYKSEILTVSAINSSGYRWKHLTNSNSGSCYGDAIDICAPGENITTIDYTGYTGYATGTSYSCAFVAGVVALVLERNPYLTGQEVRDIIEQTANKNACQDFYANASNKGNGMWNQEYGYGLVNAAAAVQAACKESVVENKTFSGSQKIEGCSVKVKNSSIQSGAKLTIDAIEQVTIEGIFEAPMGAELEVKVNR